MISKRLVKVVLSISLATLGLVTLAGCSLTEEKRTKIVTRLKPEELVLTRVGIQGTLTNTDGTPIGGVVVKVVTNYDNDDTATTKKGKFQLNTKYAPGEEVHFHFSGQGLNSVETIYQIPTGLDPLVLYFTVQPDMSVKFAAYEY